MDELWHAAILDPRFYADLQVSLEVVLHHRPSGAAEAESQQREQRLAAMKGLYSGFFSEEPQTQLSAQAQPTLKTQSSPATTVTIKLVHPPKYEGFLVTVHILLSTEITVVVEINPRTTVDYVLWAVAEMEGAKRSALCLFILEMLRLDSNERLFGYLTYPPPCKFQAIPEQMEC